MTKIAMMMLLSLSAACSGGADSFTSADTDEPVVKVEPACKANVTGRLTLANGSNSAQTVQINGIDYGKINTGAEVNIDLPPGEYTIQFIWLGGLGDGWDACTAASATVSICSTQHMTCAG